MGLLERLFHGDYLVIYPSVGRLQKSATKRNVMSVGGKDKRQKVIPGVQLRTGVIEEKVEDNVDPGYPLLLYFVCLSSDPPIALLPPICQMQPKSG